jgi:hypothetical protein
MTAAEIVFGFIFYASLNPPNVMLVFDNSGIRSARNCFVFHCAKEIKQRHRSQSTTRLGGSVFQKRR